MDGEPGMAGRSPTKVVLWHVLGVLLTFFVAYWLRTVSLEPDPVLQGYLQVISALLAFVFAALTLVPKFYSDRGLASEASVSHAGCRELRSPGGPKNTREIVARQV